jgi:polyhydroxyalkanoate synthase
MADHPTPPPGSADSASDAYATGMRILLEGARIATGQTPKEVIWTKNKARLYHYQASAPKRFATPILLVYALINRPYVLDLRPGNSLVEYLSGQGFDVYLLDWGIPGDEDSALTFDHYVLDYLPRAIHQALRTAGAAEFTLFGYCMGGTMCAMYAALFPARPLRNLVLLTSPIDFAPEHTGLLGQWTSATRFDPDRVVEAFGNVPAELIDMGMRMLKPVTNYVGTYATMWERLQRGRPMDTWLAMNKWVNDGVPFAGAAFCQWIRDFYQGNKLTKGELTLRGRRVDLAHITCPILCIAGKKDHICAPPQAEAALKLTASGDKEWILLDAGHVGLLTGAEAKQDLWPRVRGWLAPRSIPIASH